MRILAGPERRRRWSDEQRDLILAEAFKEFNRMLRRVIEADQLPDYGMDLAETTNRRPAVQFRRRGEAETLALALALAEKMRAEEERRARFNADRRRTEEMDARIDKLAGRC